MISHSEIKSLRDALGKTQTELAQILGVSRLAISRWENGVPPTKEDEAKLNVLMEHIKRRKDNGNITN